VVFIAVSAIRYPADRGAGPVKAVSLVSAASGVSPWTMLKMICHSLRHALLRSAIWINLQSKI
jgi:hypothetical protein